ncbi:hypothetical protein BDV12DRAFT_117000 [Aspergillus spectabilis]
MTRFSREALQGATAITSIPGWPASIGITSIIILFSRNLQNKYGEESTTTAVLPLFEGVLLSLSLHPFLDSHHIHSSPIHSLALGVCFILVPLSVYFCLAGYTPLPVLSLQPCPDHDQTFPHRQAHVHQAPCF